MESMSTLIINLVASLVIGFLFSLPILIPPLRRWARNNHLVRIASIIIFGLLAYSIPLVSLTRLTLEIYFVFGVQSITQIGVASDDGIGIEHVNNEELKLEFNENKPAIIQELWSRQFSRSGNGHPCITENATVCELADELSSYIKASGSSLDGRQAFFCGACLFTTVICCSFVWFFTRKKVARPE